MSASIFYMRVITYKSLNQVYSEQLKDSHVQKVYE